MKRFFIFILLLFSLNTINNTAFAHDLIPKDVQDYIEDNPNASPEEIQNFIEQNNPEFSESVQSESDVIALINNQNTNFWDNAFDFIKLGIKHILDGPDHILFVLSLLLVFVSLKEVLKLSMTFTIAHSITLILAGAGILILSPRIIEPLIAFSISFIAITSVFFKNSKFFESSKSKIATVFFFGLFHGLGFAGLLKEIKVPEDKFISSLLSFNVCIELGQLLIISLALPFIYLFRKKSWYEKLIKVLSVLIALAGIVWGIQRIIG